MLSNRAGIIVTVIAAAIIMALIMYGVDITGEEAIGVKGVVKP